MAELHSRPSRHWYECWLQRASSYDRAGETKEAVKCLDKAERHTSDDDELRYLNIWRNRLHKAK